MNLMPVAQLLSQAAEGGGKPRGGGWDIMLLMLLPIVGLFWWMSRSQKKREQQRKDMIGSLKKGDKIVTIGGIHGEVTRLSEREVVLMVDKSKGIELRLLRTAIASAGGGKEGDASDSGKSGGEGGHKS